MWPPYAKAFPRAATWGRPFRISRVSRPLRSPFSLRVDSALGSVKPRARRADSRTARSVCADTRLGRGPLVSLPTALTVLLARRLGSRFCQASCADHGRANKPSPVCLNRKRFAQEPFSWFSRPSDSLFPLWPDEALRFYSASWSESFMAYIRRAFPSTSAIGYTNTNS